MTRDDIIKLAREAGVGRWDAQEVAVERFAALVAAAEREACAKLVEDKFDFCGDELTAATAIRARGQRG